MKKALLILDMEEAFMNENTKDLENKIEDYVALTYYDHIIVGKFINQLNSPFVKTLGDTKCLDPKDCTLLVQLSKPHIVMERTAYTMYTEELEQYLKEEQIKYIYLCGMDTDRSILKTAIDLFERGYSIYIIKSLCKSSVGIENHTMAISLLERLIGKEYII